MTPSQTPTDLSQILTLLAAARGRPGRQEAGASVSVARRPWFHFVGRRERPDLGSATRRVHGDWRELQRRPACVFPLLQSFNRLLTSASTSVP